MRNKIAKEIEIQSSYKKDEFNFERDSSSNRGKSPKDK